MLPAPGSDDWTLSGSRWRNGAGKSTLLDLPILIGEMLKSRDIEEPLFQPRGSRPARAETPADILFARAGDSCVFVIEAKIPETIADQIERNTFEVLRKREQAARASNPRRRLNTIRYELGFGLAEWGVRDCPRVCIAFARRSIPNSVRASWPVGRNCWRGRRRSPERNPADSRWRDAYAA